MKKIVLSSLLQLALFTTVAFAAENLVITHSAGNPQIIRGGQTLPVTEKMLCYAGDILKTPSPECQIDLAMNGLAGCRILASSECLIQDGSRSNMAIQITNGNAILNLKKLPKDSSFRVETPTAIASVRGTQFWGRVDANNPLNSVTTFAVREGIVQVYAKKADKTFSLQKGQALDLPQDGGSPDIRPALTEELNAMQQASSIKTSA